MARDWREWEQQAREQLKQAWERRRELKRALKREQEPLEREQTREQLKQARELIRKLVQARELGPKQARELEQALIQEQTRKQARKLEQALRARSGNPWDLRTVTLLAHLLPPVAREEWRGDLYEARQSLVDHGYAQPWVALITLGRTALLLWALLRTKAYDTLLNRDWRRQNKP